MADWALVTGCLGPVGRSICSGLSNAGFQVLGSDLAVQRERLQSDESVADVELDEFVAIDLSSSDAIRDGLESIKRKVPSLGVLVNNAAITNAIDESKSDQPLADAFARSFQVNATAPYLLSVGLQALMEKSNSGSIVNIASIYGLSGPVPALYEETAMGLSPAYAASKGALIQITRYLSMVMAPMIRVNAVAPGGIARHQPANFVERYQRLTPLGRMGTEADVAGAVCWLAGPESRYVTGQVIAVDGGWTVS